MKKKITINIKSRRYFTLSLSSQQKIPTILPFRRAPKVFLRHSCRFCRWAPVQGPGSKQLHIQNWGMLMHFEGCDFTSFDELAFLSQDKVANWSEGGLTSQSRHLSMIPWASSPHVVGPLALVLLSVRKDLDVAPKKLCQSRDKPSTHQWHEPLLIYADFMTFNYQPVV